MLIRKFKPTDLQAVLELFHDTVHAVGIKYYDLEQINAWAPPIDSLDKEEWLQSLMANTTYIAEDNGFIIGFGDMTEDGYIDRLYVHKNYQGKGVAFVIFRALEEKARTLGSIELLTEASINAKPFFERQGFGVIQERRKIRRGQEFITYMMRKTI